MLRAFEPWHLVIIGGIATVLFGAKRLPDSARSLGQSLRILKSEVGAAHSPGDQGTESSQTAPAALTDKADHQPAPTVAPAAAPIAAPACAPAENTAAATAEKQTA